MSTLSTLEANSLKGALEALLLVSSDPVSAPALAGALDIAPGECASLLAELKVEYEEANRGFQLREVAGGWRLFTHPAYHDVVEAYVLSWDTQKLSQAALETLAVIAYHQPVTREVVKGIRGVNSDGVIASLVDKGLVRELGRDPERGQAIIYGTTNAFLEKFRPALHPRPARSGAVCPRRAVTPVYPRAPERSQHSVHARGAGRGPGRRARTDAPDSFFFHEQREDEEAHALLVYVWRHVSGVQQ